MSAKSNAALAQLALAIKAVEDGTYRSELLTGLLGQEGDVGQLARAIAAMERSTAFHRNQYQLLQKVVPIGVSLSAERNFNRLLESLVIEAQNITHADAGTLYLLEGDVLKFVIVRNISLNIYMGGTSGKEITFPPVLVYHADGSENRANVASYATLTRREINIEDAYNTSAAFDFSGTKSFDQNTGYRSKSFLTIPLQGKEKDVIGVLQLINAKDLHTGEIVPFASDDGLWALVLLATAALDGYLREERLRAEIAKLRIQIDDQNRDSQVAEITDTDYFKNLQIRAKQLRSERKDD
ncbi:MAG TPA: GAF domain-containing protein [Anaerolineales bacterium]|nr:GAF domain-containing protein [Anaerolineales bacterium]